jgi:hypothetical protein
MPILITSPSVRLATGLGCQMVYQFCGRPGDPKGSCSRPQLVGFCIRFLTLPRPSSCSHSRRGGALDVGRHGGEGERGGGLGGSDETGGGDRRTGGRLIVMVVQP